MCALERTPLPTFSLSLNSDQILAVQADIVNERPVIYFVKNTIAKLGQYLAYRITGGLEEITIVDSVGNPSFVYSPIINVDKFPASMLKNSRISNKSGYTAIKLMDIYSLAKVEHIKQCMTNLLYPYFYIPKTRLLILILMLSIPHLSWGLR